MIKDGGVVIVDEFTGRLMPGRRWSDGLHQAVEAKEKVKIERENQTLATITFQNYFRKYKKLSGMTGTAETEAPEFDKIYNLDVIVVADEPAAAARRGAGPRLPDASARSTTPSSTTSSRSRQSGRPTLVGTVSIEKSERLSTLLRKRGIKHVVLNAKYHAQEAEIVAQAGRKGNVTIATNMAGRGTDILLGGNAEHMARQQAWPRRSPRSCRRARRSSSTTRSSSTSSTSTASTACRAPTGSASSRTSSGRPRRTTTRSCSLGGLHILGTERHEARRIDNQLRGRAGRQGDPGSSRFYLSLEDDLMRIFGSDRISGLMQRLGMEEGVPIEHGMVTRAIERAQKQVEAQNFSVRKHLLEYDDVMNKQRESVYTLRREILEGKVHLTEEEVVDTRAYVLALAEEHPRGSGRALRRQGARRRGMGHSRARSARRRASSASTRRSSKRSSSPSKSTEEIGDAIWALAKKSYEEKEQLVGAELLRRVERDIMLQIVDAQWKDHLYSLDHLKEGIGLRGYGQRDPLVEYKKESFALFQDMKARIEEEIVRYLFWLRPVLERGGAGAAAVRARTRRADDDEQPRGGGDSAPSPAAARQRRGRGARRGRPAARPQPARTGGDDVDQDGAARGAQGGPKRSVPVRQRQEIQEVPRRSRVNRRAG